MAVEAGYHLAKVKLEYYPLITLAEFLTLDVEPSADFQGDIAPLHQSGPGE